MEELTARERTPRAILVHRLACQHDRGMLGEVGGVHADRAVGAAVVEGPSPAGAARSALEDVQIVRVGVAQRPELVLRRDDDVQRIERQLIRDPACRGGESRAHVAAVLVGLLGHEREEALGVCCTLHEPEIVLQACLQRAEVLDHPVVREQAVALLERMRVLGEDRARRGVPDVGDERR